MTFQFVTWSGARCAEHHCPSGLVGTVGLPVHQPANTESHVFPEGLRDEEARL
jgi:hypothetical protein